MLDFRVKTEGDRVQGFGLDNGTLFEVTAHFFIVPVPPWRPRAVCACRVVRGYARVSHGSDGLPFAQGRQSSSPPFALDFFSLLLSFFLFFFFRPLTTSLLLFARESSTHLLDSNECQEEAFPSPEEFTTNGKEMDVPATFSGVVLNADGIRANSPRGPFLRRE